MARPVYYAQNMLFSKKWQRISATLVVGALGLSVGSFMQNSSLKRFDSFRGRTALYGDSTLNGGRQL